MASRPAVIQGFFSGGTPRIARTATVQPHAATPDWVRQRISFAGPVQPKIAPQAASRIPQAPAVQRLANGTVFQLPAHLPHALPGPGQPLPAAVRQKMESFFHTSFNDVRIHVGPHVAAIGAIAYTQGSEIHFAPGRYDPVTPQGQEILARQLTHVVQQRGGRVQNPFPGGVAVVQNSALDGEAERMGRQWAAAQRAGTIQRHVSYNSRRGTRIVITHGSDRGDTGTVIRKSTVVRNTLVVEFDNEPDELYRVHVDEMDLVRDRSRSRSPRRDRSNRNDDREAPSTTTTTAPQARIERTGPDEHNYYTLTAYYGSTRQGSVKILLSQSGSCELSQLAVEQDQRRHGVGTALMNAAIETARANRQDEIWIDAQAQTGISQSNLTAFYQRFGFDFDNSKRERNMSLPLRF